ncbi:MAG: ATP-binding protein [Imperialibacter sp.]|uniref:ATP-binding protein n=1 Tax=Imperialibacter sp. TaxID=2038411 RepID=UPI003A8C6A5C
MSNSGGSGLGLALCKEFVTKLGGEIWLARKKGNGSDFRFTLPLNSPEYIFTERQSLNMSSQRCPTLRREMSMLIKKVACFQTTFSL